MLAVKMIFLIKTIRVEYKQEILGFSVAADEWLKVLLDVIPVLPTNVLQNEVSQ